PYYSFIKGNDKIISVYEFYRGKYKIMKKIMSISKDGKMNHETPLVFLNLIKKREQSPQKIENAIENLKRMKDEIIKNVEELKEGYQQQQRGFLYNLYNALLVEREKATGIENKFKAIMTDLQTIPYYIYSREIKPLLINKGLIKINRDNIILNNFRRIVEILYEFFRERGLINIKSLKVGVKHAGWFYEV
ncbi:MAG: hypothetical protein ACTSVV_00770, partial [Promethearchaeota archaeon]